MNDDRKLVHISGLYKIIVAVISGIFLIIIVLITWCLPPKEIPKIANPHERSPESSLKISKIESFPELVNKKSFNYESSIGKSISNHEIATFQFTLSNSGIDSIQVTSGDFLIDKVKKLDGLIETLMYIPSMNHEDHIQVIVEKPKIGDCLPIDLNTMVAPNNGIREFTIWFRSQLPTPSILYLTGRLRLNCIGGTIISNPIEIQIHSDSWEMSTQKTENQ
ncbi:MAG: hypothetical protein ABSE63_15275 [Thermoguttaceae bacterium]